MKYKNKLSLLLSTVILASSVVNAYASPFSGLLRRMGSGPTDTTSSVVTIGDMNHMYKTGSTLDAKPYTFKEDGSDGDGIKTNNKKVYQNSNIPGPIVMPWEQYYDGLSKKDKKECVLVRDKLTINKKKPGGKDPLVGVKFTVKYGSKDDDKIEAITDENGKAVLDFSELSNGAYTITEAEQEIEGVTYKSKTIKVYKDDGTRFLGEVTGEDLGITYDNIYYNMKDGNKGSKIPASQLNGVTGVKYIQDQYQEELNKGGIWLKFYDGKAKRIYYISKKPIVNEVSWNNIKASGMLYGPDSVKYVKELTKSEPIKKVYKGEPIEGVFKGDLKDYTPKILTSTKTNTKYQPALLRGRSNYGDPIGPQNTYANTPLNSQWNRTILPITKQYRFELSSTDMLEDILKQGNSYGGYINNNYIIQLADYNWFGDLTLGSYYNFKYKDKDVISADSKDNGVYSKGQYNWTQESNINSDRDSYSAYRGSSSLDYGATNSNDNNASDGYNQYGLRLVLYPLPDCYDDMCFEGEVTGNSLGITYDNIAAKLNKNTISNISSNNEIKDLYEKELANGGIWLKFTDYKKETMKNNKGKPVTFYISKKPIVNAVSWDKIKSSGMMYGPDVINRDGTKVKSTVKLDPNNELDNYKPTILTSTTTNTYYQPALLRGRSDYGKPLSSGKDSYYVWQQAKESQWNRSIVAITSSYRGEKDSMEDNLITKTNGDKYMDSYLNKPNLDLKYKTADYNWFGDLTLVASGSFEYNGKNLDSIGRKGQWNWTQEHSSSDSYRAGRGRSGLDFGAANSNGNNAGGDDASCGLRLALYPLSANN